MQQAATVNGATAYITAKPGLFNCMHQVAPHLLHCSVGPSQSAPKRHLYQQIFFHTTSKFITLHYAHIIVSVSHHTASKIIEFKCNQFDILGPVRFEHTELDE